MVQHKFKSTLKILDINFNINTETKKIEKKVNTLKHCTEDEKPNTKV